MGNGEFGVGNAPGFRISFSCACRGAAGASPPADGGAVKNFGGGREGRPAGVGDYDFDRGQNAVKMA